MVYHTGSGWRADMYVQICKGSNLDVRYTGAIDLAARVFGLGFSCEVKLYGCHAFARCSAPECPEEYVEGTVQFCVISGLLFC